MPSLPNSHSVAKQVAVSAMMAVFAIAISYIERLLPLNIGVPGIKLGLANIVVVLSLYLLGTKYALVINLLRIFILSFLFTGPYGLIYSLCGGLLSFGAMVLLKRTTVFSIIGVSVGGSILHNTGQILAAMVLMSTSSLLYYLPVLIITGTVTGTLIGLISGFLLKKLTPIMEYLHIENTKQLF